ncbi:MAG: hypothetical protein Q8Q97_00545 [bacterium]|nr:hypothetical protein [bacterium]
MATAAYGGKEKEMEIPVGIRMTLKQSGGFKAIKVSSETLKKASELIARKRKAFGPGPSPEVELVVGSNGTGLKLFKIRFDTIWGAMQIFVNRPGGRVVSGQNIEWCSCFLVESATGLQGVFEADHFYPKWSDSYGILEAEEAVDCAYKEVLGAM